MNIFHTISDNIWYIVWHLVERDHTILTICNIIPIVYILMSQDFLTFYVFLWVAIKYYAFFTYTQRIITVLFKPNIHSSEIDTKQSNRHFYSFILTIL